MSDEWEVIEKREDIVDLAADTITLGLWSKFQDIKYKYIIRNTDTLETKTVLASDGFELGERISEGDFEEE